MQDPVVIVGLARTPMGGLLGELSSLSASELGAIAVKAALAEAGVAGANVDWILMGNVLPAGQGQAPARQAQRALV
jgi:acetyl-CoA C-acetyltransferase